MLQASFIFAKQKPSPQIATDLRTQTLQQKTGEKIWTLRWRT